PEDRRDVQGMTEPAEHPCGNLLLLPPEETRAGTRVLHSHGKPVPGDRVPGLLLELHELRALAAVLPQDKMGARIRQGIAEPGNRACVAAGGCVPDQMGDRRAV